MNVRFTVMARAELREAVRFYDDQCPGLGMEFAREVEVAIERIKLLPEGWQSLSPNTRRCQTQRFSFGVLYQFRNDDVLIVAVADPRRAPEHWKDRI